jgi:hypothetical protein
MRATVIFKHGVSQDPWQMSPAPNDRGQRRVTCKPTWRSLAGFAVVVAAACPLIDHWLENKQYVFTTAEIETVALQSLAAGPDAVVRMANITAELTQRYPGLIHEEDWIFMRAGGWMGSFKLLYASVSEYVLLFGTAMPTSGHSGRYWANITDTLISGRFVQWEEGAVHPIVHTEGVTVPHPAWTVTGVHWEGGTWMLEHAKGFIPSATAFAFSDGVFSSQDFWSLGKSLWVYGKHVTRNLVAGRL